MKCKSFFSFIMAFVCLCLTGASFAVDSKDSQKLSTEEAAKAMLKKKTVDVTEEAAQDILADDSADGEKFSDSEQDDLSLDSDEDQDNA